MHFDTLAKHSPVNSEKYAASLFDLIQEFKNRFQDFRENNQQFAIFETLFLVNINMLPANFQMECIELQFDIQLKEKFDHVSLLDFYRSYLPRDNYPVLYNHALFMPSLFGSTYICVQLFSRMKHIKSKIRTEIIDQRLENSLRSATASIKPDIDALVSQLQCQTFHWLYVALFPFTFIVKNIKNQICFITQICTFSILVITIPQSAANEPVLLRV